MFMTYRAWKWTLLDLLTNTRSIMQHTARPAKNEPFWGNIRFFHALCMICMLAQKNKNNGRPHKLHKILYWASSWLEFDHTFTHILHCKSITHILFLASYYFSLRSMVSSVVLLHSTPAVSITSTATVIKLASSFSSTMVISAMLPILLQSLPTQSPMKSTTWVL